MANCIMIRILAMHAHLLIMKMTFAKMAVAVESEAEKVLVHGLTSLGAYSTLHSQGTLYIGLILVVMVSI